MDELGLVRASLARLGIERLVLGIHDGCFPSAPGEDFGRGTPYDRGGHDFVRFVASLGFTGIQLGPQGEISAFDPSPYDGTVFSRGTQSIALLSLAEDERWGRALPIEEARAVHDHRSRRRALARAFVDLGPRMQAFRAQNADWLEPDARYEAIGRAHAPDADDPVDFAHWTTPLPPIDERAIDRWVFLQLVAHEQHLDLRALTQSLGLALYADLQIGWSRRDVYNLGSLFLQSHRMGAPPSRTNPLGQPWEYPVFDPAQLPAALAWMRRRVERIRQLYDGIRIDHPHGIVTPWVYRDGAVRDGARLYDSPDLPELARFAIARLDQLSKTARRWDDDWVSELDDEQVDRYGVIIDTIVETLGDPRHAICEVLSTMPNPLGRVLARHGLGRFRITQKASLEEPDDVYRSENARPEDWIMLGNHDTPPIRSVTRRWEAEGTLGARAEYLEQRLRMPVERDPDAVARAAFADVLASPAKNVFVWWGDLFGETETYNRPGLVDPRNWTLRVSNDYATRYERDRKAGTALDLPRALAVALRARGL